MEFIRATCSVLLLTVWVAGSAYGQDRQLDLLERAATTVSTLRGDAEMGEALNGHLADAKAVLVLPNLLKAGFIVAGEGGNGVVLVRNDTGTWSAPAFVEFAGPSIGLQVGGSRSQAVFTAMTDGARNKLSSDSFKVGAGVQVAMFVVGARQQAGLDMYGYARSKGVTLGLHVSGSSITAKPAWNEAFYGKEIHVDEIVGNLDLIDARSDGLRTALSEPAS